MAVPGCPELARWGASMARPRMTLMPSCSSSDSLTRPTVPGWPRRPTAAARSRGAGHGRAAAAGWSAVGGRVPEQGHRGREAVDEVLAAERSQLAGGEE